MLGGELASQVMFAALQRHGDDVPQSPAEVRALAQGPLREVLRERGHDEATAQLDALLDESGGASLEIEIDLDSGEPSVTIPIRISFREPVVVLVIARSDLLADRIVASLGRPRVTVTVVNDIAEMRRATFSKMPLLAFVDASQPPEVDPVDLAKALRDLPGSTTGVIWGSDLQFGQLLDQAIATTGGEPLRVRRADGFEPLLDLILARYQEDTQGV